MAQTVGAVIQLQPERVRSQRWQATNTNLRTVIDQLWRLESELRLHDVDDEDHPHPRNCVLNLIILLSDRQRVEACDRLVAELSASHPMRAILLHLNAGDGAGTLDAEITADAHQLVNGFPVQREQVLLRVRGAAADHLAGLVEPLLVTDVPTFLWWCRKQGLDHQALSQVIDFSDVLIVDSAQLERPVEALLDLATLAARPDHRIGISDLRWARLRPWCDAISQFFAPAGRHRLLAALHEVDGESAGSSPQSRVGAALLAGWAAAALGWRFVNATANGNTATEAVAETAGGKQVRVRLRSVPSERMEDGEVIGIHLSGQTNEGPFKLAIERDRDLGNHAHVTIELGGEPIRQRLTLPRMGDPDLLLHVLWASHRDLVFESTLVSAATLLEALR